MPDSSEQRSSAGRSAAIRRNVLVGILVLLGVALAYDYLVARAGVENAYNLVNTRYEELVGTTELLTDDGIQELLGREPSRTFEQDREYVEVYSWRSGLPVRTHDLFVVYRKIDGEWTLLRHSKFAFDGEGLETEPRGVANDEDDSAGGGGAGGDGGEPDRTGGDAAEGDGADTGTADGEPESSADEGGGEGQPSTETGAGDAETGAGDAASSGATI